MTEKPSHSRRHLHPSLQCPREYREGDITPKEFFVFNHDIVWCNVFKSASTSVLYIMGLLEGFTMRRLKSMSKHPLVSEMRKIYGRPTLAKLLNVTRQPQVKTFLVKRHPFKRLFSGYQNKILGKWLMFSLPKAPKNKL